MRLVEKERLKNRFNAESERFSCYRWDLSAIIDEIDDAPTITMPPNDPLTLEELREMDGEPVCIYNRYNGLYRWKVVHHAIAEGVFFTDGTMHRTSECGDAWLAYRRKPEETIQ